MVLKNKLMLKKIVAFTPLFGALSFPLIVPLTITKFGINNALSIPQLVPNFEIVIGTIRGNVNAPNKGVKATIFFNIKLIY